MKYCVDCAHYGDADGYCGSPRNVVRTPAENMVYGMQDILRWNFHIYADENRADEGACGRAARWFEQGDDKDTRARKFAERLGMFDYGPPQPDVPLEWWAA